MAWPRSHRPLGPRTRRRTSLRRRRGSRRAPRALPRRRRARRRESPSELRLTDSGRRVSGFARPSARERRPSRPSAATGPQSCSQLPACQTAPWQGAESTVRSDRAVDDLANRRQIREGTLLDGARGMSGRFLTFASAALALSVAACGSSSPSPTSDTASIAPDAAASLDEARSNLARDSASSLPDGGADVAVAANNAFALDLYSRVRAGS